MRRHLPRIRTFVLAAHVACAARPGQRPPAPSPEPPARAAGFAAGEAAGPLALGALEPRLPACPQPATAPEQEFCDAAGRTVRATFDDDVDDTAPLLALQNALETRAELARLQEPFAPVLDDALSRAQLLASCGRPLRQLRRSLRDAYRDPRSQLFRGVDGAGCRTAFAALEALPGPWLDLVVTIEPLGTYPLSAFRRFCLDDRQLGEPVL